MELHPTPYGYGEKCKETIATCQEMPSKLLENTSECLSSNDANISSRHRKWDSIRSKCHSNSNTVFSGSVMSAQMRSINLQKELREIYKIEERIFEENRKIQEFRNMEHAQAAQEQESAFEAYKAKLSFLITLHREQNHVERLEQSLANEEAKKRKSKRKKLDMDRLKKYCQTYVKENVSLFSAPRCACFTCSPMEQSNNIGAEVCKNIKVCSPVTNSVQCGPLQDRRIVEGSEMSTSESRNSVKSAMVIPEHQ
ncbi:uncharacterized protein LOC128482727 [Spea bombifrons]|uniref:uncharacterized protein LOC128482727 n=1 Tax=Spea bombifrons TaxID=233779 RepID=UPI00234BB0BB|nr:uncharacterized protein LOC128482727 [Spea bombifrons]